MQLLALLLERESRACGVSIMSLEGMVATRNNLRRRINEKRRARGEPEVPLWNIDQVRADIQQAQIEEAAKLEEARKRAIRSPEDFARIYG